MKNANSLTHMLALLITGCAQQTFTVQNKTGSSSTKGNHHPSFLRFWIGQKKTVDAAKICGGAENVVKTETQQTFVNGLLGFITLGIYTPLEARVLLFHTQMSCPSIWATLSALLINILLGSFQLFLHSDQLPLRVKIIRSAVSASRDSIIHAGGGGGFTHWLTDCFDVQPTTTSGNIITQSIIFSQHRQSPSCILHRAQQHHADASACQ